MKIHASGEDYLEAVLVLQKNHGAVRSIDVARRVGVSKASVSYAVSALHERGFLVEWGRCAFDLVCGRVFCSYYGSGLLFP